jgi:hypothetical protein
MKQLCSAVLKRKSFFKKTMGHVKNDKRGSTKKRTTIAETLQKLSIKKR